MIICLLIDNNKINKCDKSMTQKTLVSVHMLAINNTSKLILLLRFFDYEYLCVWAIIVVCILDDYI